MGGPSAEDTPLANVSNPKALVNFSSPKRSQMIIDVSEIYAAEKSSISYMVTVSLCGIYELHM